MVVIKVHKNTSIFLYSYLKANNLIETRGRAFTKSKRINGIRTECVVLNLQADWDGDYDPDDLLPM